MSVPVTSDLNINKVGKPLVANRRVFSFLKSVYNFVEIIYISHVPHVLGGNWGSLWDQLFRYVSDNVQNENYVTICY